VGVDASDALCQADSGAIHPAATWLADGTRAVPPVPGERRPSNEAARCRQPGCAGCERRLVEVPCRHGRFIARRIAVGKCQVQPRCASATPEQPLAAKLPVRLTPTADGRSPAGPLLSTLPQDPEDQLRLTPHLWPPAVRHTGGNGRSGSAIGGAAERGGRPAFPCRASSTSC
jgi:hypothetical protein